LKEFLLLLPELFLLLTLAGIIIGEIGYRGEKIRLTSATALIGLVGAFVQTLLTYQYGATQIFHGAVAVDGLALFFKLFFILLALLTIGTSVRAKEIAAEKRAEYYGLVIASTIAMCFVASASDLLLVFLSLQLMNVLSYFLAALGKKSSYSAEAAIKKMAFGSLAAVLLLYGIGILFAYTRVLNIQEMHKVLTAAPLAKDIGAVVFMLIFLALSFQIGAFPMHLWAPDVLEGAPTPASAFISVGSRAAGFALALRFFIIVFAQPVLSEGEWTPLGGFDWTKVVALISGLTMVIGSLLAFRQVGAKRLVACLVVAQTGFLLMGLLVLDRIGIASLLYNLVIELFALVGVFYVISFFVDELNSDRLEDLKGMLAKRVPESIALILFLACLVGVPPLPGFIGKFTLIGAVISHQWYSLAAIAIIAIAIGTIATARLAFSLVGDFRKQKEELILPDTARTVSLLLLFIPMLLAGVFAQTLLSWAVQSLNFVIW